MTYQGCEEGFWQAAWGGLFQLLVISLAAFFVNILYQRFREHSAARQQLIDEIDQFTIRLYKPRKMYQILMASSPETLTQFADPDEREAWRTRMIQRYLGEFVEAVGRFRAVQVKLVALYGHHQELFAFYLAIWRYLKEIRQRMEGKRSLYFHHETPQSFDAFYRLVDAFRYKVAVEKVRWQPHRAIHVPHEELTRWQARGDMIYDEYFKATTKELPAAGSQQEGESATR
jgi:hypothetical protein